MRSLKHVGVLPVNRQFSVSISITPSCSSRPLLAKVHTGCAAASLPVCVYISAENPSLPYQPTLTSSPSCMIMDGPRLVSLQDMNSLVPFLSSFHTDPFSTLQVEH